MQDCWKDLFLGNYLENFKKENSDTQSQTIIIGV